MSSSSASGFWSRALSLSSGCCNDETLEKFENPSAVAAGGKLPGFHHEIPAFAKSTDPYQHLPPLEPISGYPAAPADQSQSPIAEVPFRYEGIAVPKDHVEQSETPQTQAGAFYNPTPNNVNYYDEHDSTLRGTVSQKNLQVQLQGYVFRRVSSSKLSL